MAVNRVTERRRVQRRCGGDRRAELRWEGWRLGRRQGRGRRLEDQLGIMAC
ncbi:hypothetical protein [Ferrimonas gelatinilytica]|uniref:hypothetical protein n=1 Tax=Ferrimonas gelatinilytica TaxID=1255257 RepID=UPI0031EDD22A